MGVKLGQIFKKKTTPLPLFAHSQDCFTYNQTLKRKRRDNFNDMRECILRTNLFISMKEISVLARNKCYILPYCQRIDLCVEVKYFARYSLTAMSLTLPFIPTCSLEDIHKNLIEHKCHHFSVHNCVEGNKSLMMPSQKSGFKSTGLWYILHLLAKIPKVHSTILRVLDNL